MQPGGRLVSTCVCVCACVCVCVCVFAICILSIHIFSVRVIDYFFHTFDQVRYNDVVFFLFICVWVHICTFWFLLIDVYIQKIYLQDCFFDEKLASRHSEGGGLRLIGMSSESVESVPLPQQIDTLLSLIYPPSNVDGWKDMFKFRYVCVCMCVCVHACLRACVCACVRAAVRQQLHF